MDKDNIAVSDAVALAYERPIKVWEDPKRRFNRTAKKEDSKRAQQHA